MEKTAIQFHQNIRYRKNIEVDIDDNEMAFLPDDVKAGTSALSHGDLSDFLNIAKNVSFGFFTIKIK